MSSMLDAATKQASPVAQLTEVTVSEDGTGPSEVRQVTPPSEVVLICPSPAADMQCRASPQDTRKIAAGGRWTDPVTAQVRPLSADRIAAIPAPVLVPVGASPMHLPLESQRREYRNLGE